jgi:hypothetical protein
VIWKDRDGSLLSHVRVSIQLPIALKGELELCNGYRDHCLKILIAFGIGLTWSISQVWQTLVISCITPIKFNWYLRIWSNHKFVSWHNVWTLFGVVHFAYMCSTRLISCLYLLCALLVVNPLLNCSNLIKLAKMSYFISFGHFEHLLALVFVALYT